MRTLVIVFLTALSTIGASSSTSHDNPRDALLSNIEKGLQSRDLVSLFVTLERINEVHLSISDYLNLIKIASAPEAPPCFINIILDKMNKDFPEYKINSYFFSNGALKEKGLKIIIDHYRESLNPSVQSLVLNSYDSLKSEVKRIMNSDPSFGIFFHEGNNAHWTLIYFNKNLKTHTCVVQILDSVGHEQVLRLKGTLSEALPGNCKIALNTERRQYDTTTCSIFALTDFLELSSRDDEGVEFLSSQGKHLPGNLVKMKLAPSLMKLAQIDPHTGTTAFQQSLHEMADTVLITLPKQRPVESPLEKEIFEGKFCSGDSKAYFNFEKEVVLNVGSKVLHDQYVLQILQAITGIKK